PTIADFYPGFETTSWVGVIAPAGTPRPIIDRLNGTLARILAAPDMKEKFDVQSAEIVAGTPEQFGELIKSETVKWGKISREKNIRVDRRPPASILAGRAPHPELLADRPSGIVEGDRPVWLRVHELVNVGILG